MMTNTKVLIADDDPLIVRGLSARCTRLGLEVQTAKDGLQAILRASRNPPRLIILDLLMPEADGFRVCEWLLEPERPPVDILILTARSDQETNDRCESFGAFRVVKGPDAWAEMLPILREVFNLDDMATSVNPPVERADPLLVGSPRN